MKSPRAHPIAAVSLLLLCHTTALAQDELVEEEMRGTVLDAGEVKDKKSGWSVGVKIGFTGSLTDSRNVVGAQEGTTLQIGALLAGRALWIAGQQEWETVLEIQHTQTKTPQINRFVKSSDSLDLKSTYLYRFVEPSWAGAFGRFRLLTQILPADVVLEKDRTIVRDGVPEAGPRSAQTSVDLTAAFEPLALRETLGIFANPIEERRLTAKLKIGGGAQEIITRDGFVVADDGATPELEIVELQSLVDLGLESDLDLSGVLVEELVSWSASANVFIPFVTTAETDLSTIERLNAEFRFSASLKLVDWLSLDYLLSARRVPLVLEEWQVQNAIVLSAGFEVI